MPFFPSLRPITSATLFSLFFCNLTPGLAQSAVTPETLNFDGEYLMLLDEEHTRWLSVGENTGIQVLDSKGKAITQWPQTAEFLDSRIVQTASGQQRIFVSFDGSQSRVLLYSLDAQQSIRQEFISPTLDFPVEGLCLYQDGAQRLHLFLLSELFEARQYLLLPTRDTQWEMLALRSLPTGPSSEFCAVDDNSATLFVSESAQTLWSYSANPEAEVERELLDAAAPFGNLGDGPLALAATQGRLYALSEDGPSLHQFDLRDGEFHRAEQGLFDLSIAEVESVETMSLSTTGATLTVSMFDEALSRFTRFDLPAPAPTQVASELPEVTPTIETTPMPQRGDAADDPALWIHPTAPEQSLVIGTNKRQGLFVYDLDGQEVQRLNVGRVNNVDVRYGISWQGREIDVAVATNRDLNTLSMFSIDRESRELTLVADIPTPLQNIYGMCLYQDTENRLYAFANDEDGTYLQIALHTNSTQWSGEIVRSFAVATQPEGCVANDKTGQLFIGEEDIGIWTLSADPSATVQLQSVAMVGGALHDDIEGLALYDNGTSSPLLIASSQGNNSYVVLQSHSPYNVLAAFRVGMNLDPTRMIDGASETDGLELSSANLGGPYSMGLLIVQDGRNVLPEQAQNFKLVPWRDVQALFPALGQ